MGHLLKSEKRQFFRFADADPLNSVLKKMSTWPGLQRYLDFDQRYYLADDILYKVDRMSMAHSLEARPPFLDPRIVDFAARLPERLKLNGSKSKYVLRRLMQDKLPPDVLRRPKIGFDIPVHDWFRSVLRPILLDTLSEEAVRASGLFHWPAVEQLLSDHLERKANHGYHLWGLMVLLFWMKRWNVGLADQRSDSTKPSPRSWIGLDRCTRSLLRFPHQYRQPTPPHGRCGRRSGADRPQHACFGDCVTARLDGVAYLEKAPLIYWMMAASYKIFGVHDWAARYRWPWPWCCCALLLIALAAGRFDESRNVCRHRTGNFRRAFSFYPHLDSRRHTHSHHHRRNLGMAGLLEPEEEHPHRWAVIMGLCFGAGLLLKGLIAVVFPVLAGIAFMAVTRQFFHWAAWNKLELWLVATVAVLIAAPWHVLAAIANPPAFAFSLHSGPGKYRGFFWFYFFNEHLLRFLNLRYPRDYNTVPRVWFWLLNLVWLFPWSAYLSGSVERVLPRTIPCR